MVELCTSKGSSLYWYMSTEGERVKSESNKNSSPSHQSCIGYVWLNSSHTYQLATQVHWTRHAILQPGHCTYHRPVIDKGLSVDYMGPLIRRVCALGY